MNKIRYLGTVFILLLLILAPELVHAGEPTHGTITPTEVRAQASKNSDKVDTLPNGKIVSLKARYGSWALIDYSGKTGYVTLSSLIMLPDQLVKKSQSKIASASSTLNIAAKPSVSIGNVNPGEIVRFVAKYGSWAQVIVGDKTGFVQEGALKSLPKTSIKITMST
ncbi:SH3 domain-containing protein [Metabacillus herbersteinensis]|uniref:SH3 domain-containing protein n=1 Tax=Metabacillus herbersteinensis TaxID=283816 RepID=A0ABV6GF51_9BACI